MSLRVWLPLRGNLENQGLSQVTVTVSGSTIFNTTGKLGQSLTCNGSSFWTITPVTLGNAATIACWTKTSTGGKMPWVIVANSSNKLNLYQSSQYTLNIGDGNANLFKDSNGNAVDVLSDNLWHHFVVTFDGTVSKLYIDGIYRGTAMTYRDPTTTSAKTIYLAGGYGGGHSYDWHGSMNDFRIYDHALSPEEVADIAKGLVLWYPLNDRSCEATTNLFAGRTNFSDATKWSKTKINADTPYIDTDGNMVLGGADNTSNTHQSYTVSSVGGYLPISANTTYTFQVTAKIESGANFRIFFYQRTESEAIKTNSYGPFTDTNNQWKTYTFTLTTQSTTTRTYIELNSYNSAIGSHVILLNNSVQLEAKDHATPFTLSTRTPTIIYDISGYKNNGTIVGNLTAAAGSPKYDVATQKVSGSYIRVDNRPNAVCAKDAITVSMWVNFSTWGNCISCTDGGGWNFEEYNGGLRFPIYIASVGYKIAQSTITSSSLKNAWHMLTGTMDSNNIKFYIDGEEVGTVATGSTNGIDYANNYIFIGGEASGNNISPENSSFVGTMSDTRIYATALTPIQIKELYNNSMLVDASGNVTPRGLS